MKNGKRVGVTEASITPAEAKKREAEKEQETKTKKVTKNATNN